MSGALGILTIGALAGGSFAFSQPTAAFGVELSEVGRVRITVGSITELLTLEAGRKVALAANAGIPVQIEGRGRELVATLSLDAAVGVGNAAGSVTLSRTGHIDHAGERLADLELALELDLLGLGDDVPAVKVVRAEVKQLDGQGALGGRLLRPSFLAVRAAPLAWSLAAGSLALAPDGDGSWTGLLRLPRAITPEYFLGDRGPVASMSLLKADAALVVSGQVDVKKVAGVETWTVAADGHRLELTWQRDGESWFAKVVADAPTELDRLTLQLGEPLGYALQAHGTLGGRPAAMLSR